MVSVLSTKSVRRDHTDKNGAAPQPRVLPFFIARKSAEGCRAAIFFHERRTGMAEKPPNRGDYAKKVVPLQALSEPLILILIIT